MRFSSHKLFARAANYRSILASVAPNASAQTPRHASLCATAPPLASRWHARGRLAAQIPIAERAARPTERTLPRFRALALFRRRSPERVASSSLPASENLHTTRHSSMINADVVQERGELLLLPFLCYSRLRLLAFPMRTAVLRTPGGRTEISQVPTRSICA
jgi:hypothetical protein